MAEYDFILDNMKYSFSSANSYLGCAGGFKLTYIDAEDRIGNCFSDFGNHVHSILEMFFKDKLEITELAQYYQDHYVDAIENSFPPYPAGMASNYFDAGLSFFENFEFDKSLYEIVFIEDYINAVWHGILLTVKPDLILKEKATGDYFLVDYKTAKLKSGKAQKEQLEEYKRQFLLYSNFLWLERNIQIKKLKIWFIRDQKEVVIDVDPLEVINTMEWFENTIKSLKEETEWKYNTSKENKYFCDNICSMRHKCKYGGAYSE